MPLSRHGRFGFVWCDGRAALLQPRGSARANCCQGRLVTVMAISRKSIKTDMKPVELQKKNDALAVKQRHLRHVCSWHKYSCLFLVVLMFLTRNAIGRTQVPRAAAVNSPLFRRLERPGFVLARFLGKIFEFFPGS